MEDAPADPERLQMKQLKVDNCPLCKKEFGVFRWSYQCVYCAKYFCDDCTSPKLALRPAYPDPQRVCTKCRPKALRYVANYIESSEPAAATGSESRGGGGRVLGGGAQGSQQGTEEEERLKRLRIIEERQAKKGATPSRPTSSGVSAKRSVVPPPSTPDKGKDEPQVPAEPQSDEGVTRQESNPMLEAALRRQQSQQSARGGATGNGAATLDPERVELLATVQATLRRKGKEEPFGLRAMDATKLRMYLRHLENE